MELKKSKKADLENKKNIFFLTGLVLALGLTLLAFNWKSKTSATQSLGEVQAQTVEDEIIPITREPEVKPPPPPEPPPVVEVLQIVENDVEIENELEIEDTEADDQTVIDVAPVIVAEKEEEEEEDQQVFLIVEDMPEFPGGPKALLSWIANAVKYPVIAQENGIQGKVYVNFVVGKNGSVSNATVARSVDPSLDQEALRVINSMPKWNPGKQRGKPVNVSYTVPINFVLQ
ncbi:MAG: energy transducer TonB [Draconibacterium sp.]|nr:MAG: energy transducer TonB [Draconibacterium sp.]